MSRGFPRHGQVELERSSSGGLHISIVSLLTAKGLTPRLDHPDNTKLSGMRFTCLGISDDLEEV